MNQAPIVIAGIPIPSDSEKYMEPRMPVPPRFTWLTRLLISLGGGLAFGVLVALVLTVADLYLTGHGYRSLGAPLLDAPAMGVHLSLADLLFLSAAVLGAAVTWRSMTRGSE
jgi:hypothetical protein